MDDDEKRRYSFACNQRNPGSKKKFHQVLLQAAHKMAPRDGRLPPCFAHPGDDAHTVGEWIEAVAEPPPYRLAASVWSSLGSRVGPESGQHYGRCDDVTIKAHAPPRKHYRWVPDRCAMQPFDADALCSQLDGKQLVVVGDSTVLQTFVSLVSLLGGTFGKDVKHGAVICDLTASACADRLRLVFVRNDLLLWSTLPAGDFDRVRRCDGFSILHPFTQRASRDADVLVLGVGHHFPRSLMLAEKGARASRRGAEVARRARIAFFARNLNHTLASALEARAAWGRTHPASVVVLGSTTPVRSCARYREPLSLSRAVEALAAGGADPEPPSANEERWQHYPRYNQLARWLATAAGATFVDVAAPSARRPDGAMGGFWPPGSPRQRDCVHSCMPGPVDSWSVMLSNLLRSAPLRRALAEAPGGAAAGAGRRFFENATQWLTARGFSERLEACGAAAGRGGGRERALQRARGLHECAGGLHRHSWWAFDCSSAGRQQVEPPRAPAAAPGEWQPWRPAESFD